jgi:hypothetical protein
VARRFTVQLVYHLLACSCGKWAGVPFCSAVDALSPVSSVCSVVCTTLHELAVQSVSCNLAWVVGCGAVTVSYTLHVRNDVAYANAFAVLTCRYTAAQSGIMNTGNAFSACTDSPMMCKRAAQFEQEQAASRRGARQH